MIKEGIELFDKGDLPAAIVKYQAALKIDSKSSTANYEIALTYFQMKDYENAIKHCDIVLKENKGSEKHAYTIKGSALDDMGKPKEAIEIYKKAIKKYPDEYLLNYNLGLSNFRIKKYEEAEEACIKAISLKNNHASSHFLLGNTMNAQGKRIQAILALYYFLLTEPNTARSKDAFRLLSKLISKGVSEDENKANTINITLSLPDGNDKFGSVETLFSLHQASTYTENKDKTEEEKFIIASDQLFTTLSEIQDLKKNKDLWWSLYADLFYKISKNNNTEAFCYYISQSSEKVAVTKWLSENKEKLEKLADSIEKE